MADKLKVIPLGGLNEIGKNLYVYECGGDILVVDCGIAFPDEEMPGVDLVTPDFTYLVKHKSRIRAIVITHGHEDHIGSLPYALRVINAPIYCTRLTAGLIEIKLEEHGLLKKTKINKMNAGQSFTAGCFKVEMIAVNHSIADAVALAIKTPLGTVIHTGDFKIDPTPVTGQMIDLARLGQLGKEGVLALFSDSTNAERPGYTMSERKVGDSFDALFRYDKRIIVSTFASNIHRIQQVINSAVKFNRKVAITGRSMENILRVAIQLDYMNIPPNTIVELSQIKNLPKNKICLITTGSQGETMSALYRMAFGAHRQIEITAGDRIIVSASPIPGNEKVISRMINELFRKGADVIYERLADIHVSGHACQEELKLMLALTKPKYFMPVHGEYKHMRAHAQLAAQCGLGPKQIFIGDTGKVFEITQNGAKFGSTVPSGRVLIDGMGGENGVGAAVLHDRKQMAEDGLIAVVMTLGRDGGNSLAGLDIVSRGFMYGKENEALMQDLKRLAAATLQSCRDQKVQDWASIKLAVRDRLSDHIFRKHRCRPMILPILAEPDSDAVAPIKENPPRAREPQPRMPTRRKPQASKPKQPQQQPQIKQQ